ncbi:MAG: hypothetical protein ACLTA1_05815 [Clostridia bacterium]
MKKTGSIIICICELLVGILLLINPVGFTTTIIIAVGIVTHRSHHSHRAGYARDRKMKT